MDKEILLIVGGKATGIEIYDLVLEFLGSQYDGVVFVVGDFENLDSENHIKDSQVSEFVSDKNCRYVISVSNNQVRKRLENLMGANKVKPTNVIHPTAIISKTADIGTGNYIAGNAVISSNTVIGNHNVINFNVTIGHDAVIKDHVVINPGARIGGMVEIDSNVLIGSNSFIFQGKRIGKDTLIDAVTYVDKDINDGMICSSKRLKVFKRVIF